MMADWAGIVAEHGPGVWRAVFRILAHRDDAWDCYQEVFLEAVRRAPREPVRDWGAFLGTLAARRAIDRLRRRAREPAGAGAFEPALVAADEPPPGDLLAADELMARVRRALAALPPRQAEVFWLACVEGWPHDRVAAQLGATPGATRMLLSRARSALAGALAELTPDPRSAR